MEENNLMTYNGNHLFHYTSLEAANKIIASNTLLFGSFKHTNDIAEKSINILCNVNDDKYGDIEKYLANYQFISFTTDDKSHRGFAIDSLWGYYANKGNGVCLVFDKTKLTETFNKLPSRVKADEIKYISNFSNLYPCDGESVDEIKKHIHEHIDDLCYTKSTDWQNEHEYRLLAYDTNAPIKLSIHDSLIAIIIHSENMKESIEFKILSKLYTPNKVLSYGHNFGNKELKDINNHILWPIMDTDYNLDL